MSSAGVGRGSLWIRWGCVNGTWAWSETVRNPRNTALAKTPNSWNDGAEGVSLSGSFGAACFYYGGSEDEPFSFDSDLVSSLRLV